jgi:lysophospholipase L1-like esterase
MPTATFNTSNANIFLSPPMIRAGLVSGAYYYFNSPQEVNFSFVGTGVTANLYSATGTTYSVSIDGGAATMITTPNTNGFSQVALATGFTEGTHSVRLYNGAGSGYIYATSTFVVTGAAPALAATAHFGSQYDVTNATFIGAMTIDGGWKSDTGYYRLLYDSEVRFYATCTEIRAWGLWGTGQVVLTIDGVIQTPITDPGNNGSSIYATFATGLDGATEHLYGIRNVSDGATGFPGFYSFMTVGGSLNTAKKPTAKPKQWAAIGDSITYGSSSTLANPFGSYVHKAGASLGFGTSNQGISGATISSMSGQFSTVTALSTLPDIATVMGGTNDVGNATAQSTFTSTYQSDIQSLVNGLPAGSHVYCLGILPRSDAHAAGVATYNGYIQTAVANVSSSKATYVDTSTWINPATDLSGDGLHPTEAGHQKIANQLISLFGPSFPFRTRRLASRARRVAIYTL